MAFTMTPSGDTTFQRRASLLTTAGRVAAVFAALIGLGTVLLELPIARVPGRSVPWLDSLFMATSATCVTGLVTVNVGETYTAFGQAVILGLIQLGGLGITSAGTMFILLRRGGSSLVSEDFIGANVGRLRAAKPVDVFLYSCFVVVAVELLGAVLLTYVLMARDADLGFGRALWEAVFHSISAFCNAGISLYPEGLVRWRDDPIALGVTCLLVILGGIGLLTLVNFRYFYPWRRDYLRRGRLTLQTRLCLFTSLALLALGTLLTFISEVDATLGSVGWPKAFLWAFFHSTMTRTAGFNVVDVGAMRPETLAGSLVLMFFGGAPGSMAGGVKVTTLVLLAVVASAALRRRSDLVVGHHSVPPDQANNAVLVTLFSVAALVVSVLLLMNIEVHRPAAETPLHWLALCFEAVSAFGTVGLSTGITALLTPAGKALIILLMFVGRLGPLCLAMHLSRPAQPDRIQYPRDEVSVG